MGKQKRNRKKEREKEQKDLGSTWDTFKPLKKVDEGKNRKQTKAAEKARQKQVFETALAEALRQRAALAAQRAGQPAGTAGSRNDGNFHLAFVKIGQGDCTIMSTPKGKVVLIDCGTNSSDRDEDETPEEFSNLARSVLEDARFLKDHSVIDVCILTHPDKDHYNRLDAIVPARCNGNVRTIYHVGDIGDYGPGATWARAAIINQALLSPVVLNETQDDRGTVTGGAITLRGQPVPPADTTTSLERRDPTGGIVVLAEPNCTITLMAAGVTMDYARDNDAQDATNRACIVTLVEVAGTQILLCADATRSTEHYLLHSPRKYRIKNVAYVTAGHHGSDTTSSGDPWVTWVDPREHVIVSTGKRGHSRHHLPSWPVVRRWGVRLIASGHEEKPGHFVSAWDLDHSLNEPKLDFVNYPLYTTGSSGTRYIDITLMGD
jgi:beta-lactamase superfamily II metal-dependent hydrolase